MSSTKGKKSRSKSRVQEKKLPKKREIQEDDSENSGPQCRYCLELVDPSSPDVIKPCVCTTYLHQGCYQEWWKVDQGVVRQNLDTCELCLTKYQFLEPVRRFDKQKASANYRQICEGSINLLLYVIAVGVMFIPYLWDFSYDEKYYQPFKDLGHGDANIRIFCLLYFSMAFILLTSTILIKILIKLLSMKIVVLNESTRKYCPLAYHLIHYDWRLHFFQEFWTFLIILSLSFFMATSVLFPSFKGSLEIVIDIIRLITLTIASITGWLYLVGLKHYVRVIVLTIITFIFCLIHVIGGLSLWFLRDVSGIKTSYPFPPSVVSSLAGIITIVIFLAGIMIIMGIMFLGLQCLCSIPIKQIKDFFYPVVVEQQDGPPQIKSMV